MARDLEKLKKLVKDNSPFGKMQTPHVTYKAYAASMAVGLCGIGLKKHEVEEIFNSVQNYGLPLTVTQEIIDLVYKEKEKSKSQAHEDLA